MPDALELEEGSLEEGQEDRLLIDPRVGHYRLLEKIGAGGMGEVYRAEDRLLDRQVALKVLSPSLAALPQYLERFQREARSVAALNHPNIVTIYTVEEHEGLHFLTTELVQGRTLAELIPPGGMPLGDLLEIAVPLAEAVESAHQRGIVHRDLKPENVMVSREGRVKVLDFGIAKPMLDATSTIVEGEDEDEKRLTRTGLLLGTPSYMSPEQILDQPVDHRTDLFSFGVILFQMATGQRPFRGGSSAEIFASILRDTPPAVSSLNSRMPKVLDDLVAGCLEKSVWCRLQSAGDLRQRLELLAAGVAMPDGAEIRAKTIPSPKPKLGWKQLAFLFVLVGGLAALGLILQRSRSLQLLGEPAGSATAKIAEREEDPRPGLAVLPLGNFSKDPEYFVDGMTDALIASLADVQGIRVISRQSVMRYKSSPSPLPQIAEELGVQMVVQGSVTRAGNRVRITAQLIRAEPEQQMWAHSYERDLRDVLSLQKEVAEAISREIEIKLEPGDRRRLAAGRPVDPEAYDIYLRGRYAWNRRNPGDLTSALRYFQEALELDPSFALAHSGLSDVYYMAANYALLPPREALRHARKHARTALEIDPDLADAHVSMGLVHLAHLDWEEAEESFRRAVSLNSNHPTAHYFYWLFLFTQGRKQEATEQIRLASKLDPLSPMIALNLGREAFLAHKDNEALEHYRKVQELNPGYPGLYQFLALLYERQGNEELAFKSFRRVLELSYAEIMPEVDRAFERGGRRAALEQAAQALEELSKKRMVRPEDIARVYIRLGERDKALDWLETTYEQGFPSVVWFDAAGEWESLRSEPRFQKLLKRIGAGERSAERTEVKQASPDVEDAQVPRPSR